MELRRLLFSLCLATAFVAQAESLEEKKKHREQEDQLNEMVKTTNEKCGTKLSANMDWKSTKKEDLQTNSPSAFCGNALEAIQSLCDEAESKAAVQKQIKKVTCKWVAEGKRSVKLSGGTLSYDIDWNASNANEFIHDYLMKHLE